MKKEEEEDEEIGQTLNQPSRPLILSSTRPRRKPTGMPWRLPEGEMMGVFRSATVGSGKRGGRDDGEEGDGERRVREELEQR